MTKNISNERRRKYLPTNDVIFKCLFGNAGNERITAKFLEDILGEKIEEVSTDFKLDLIRDHPQDKQMTADLIAKDKKLQKYIIEMQRKAYNYLPDRFIGYLSKTYVADIKVKEKYTSLKRTVLIIVLEKGFSKLKDISEYHTVWNYREQNNYKKVLTKSTEIHILELQKYKKQREKRGKIEPWLEFFINPYGEEVKKMARTREELRAAVEQLRLLSADEEVQQLADAEDWARYDYNSQLEEEREEARAKGLREGRKKGREEGRVEGEFKNRIETAKKMKLLGLQISLIEQITGLTEKEVEKL